MKTIGTAEQILEEIVGVWDDCYDAGKGRKTGSIGLCLDGEWYYIEVSPEGIGLKKHASLDVVVSLTASLEDFLLLLSKPAFAVWGVVSRRLVFKGDIAFFRQLPKVDFRKYRYEGSDKPEKFERFPVRYWKVPDKILLINGSPRGEQGYTHFLSTSFLKGMRKVCSQIKVVELAGMDIRECRGCWYCWRKGNGRCVFDGEDDCRKLLEVMDESDLIVFAFPLYSDGMPSGLKKLFDRRVATLEPFMIPGLGKTRHPRRLKKRQAMAVLSGCGFVEKKHFRAVGEHFRALAHNWHVPVVGEIYRPAVISLFNDPLCYSFQQEVLRQLEIAGEMLVRKGYIAPRIRKAIERDFISVRGFRERADYFWSKHLSDEAGVGY